MGASLILRPAIVTTLIKTPSGLRDERYHLMLVGKEGRLLFKQGWFRIDCLGPDKGQIELYRM